MGRPLLGRGSFKTGAAMARPHWRLMVREVGFEPTFIDSDSMR